tara:strand:- start:1 stop:111 length:111 start_codon:yes stop_codon:yes gene_type:complete
MKKLVLTTSLRYVLDMQFMIVLYSSAFIYLKKAIKA